MHIMLQYHLIVKLVLRLVSKFYCTKIIGIYYGNYLNFCLAYFYRQLKQSALLIIWHHKVVINGFMVPLDKEQLGHLIMMEEVIQPISIKIFVFGNKNNTKKFVSICLWINSFFYHYRRESGYCQLCWYAASLSDVDVSGVATKTAMGKQLVTVLINIWA